MDRTNRRTKITVLLFVLCAAALFLLLLGAVNEPAAKGLTIGSFSELGDELISFAETDDGLFLVTGKDDSAVVLKIQPDTGEILSRREMERPAYKAVNLGDSLFVFTESEDGLAVTGLSSELEIVSEARYPVNADELELFTVTADGICYTVPDAPNVLEVRKASGESESLTFEGEIGFLETAPDAVIFIFASGSLFRAENGSLSSLSELDFFICPEKLLSSEYLIDGDGFLCKLSSTGAETVLECSAAYRYGLTAMRDGTGIILSQSASQVGLISLNGETLGTFSADGRLLGLAPSGALFEKNSVFRYAAYDFVLSEATPVPEPDIYEGDGWLIEPQLGIIEVHQGLDASELLRAFRPAAEMVYTREGVGIVSGKLATGMTLAGYDIVIRGDCSGNGEVNSTDIRLLQSVIVGADELSGVFRTAADVDADGELTTADLVLMDKLRR